MGMAANIQEVMATPCNVKDLAFLTKERVWGLNGVFDVTFDDGEVIRMPSRYIKLSHPYWGITRAYSQIGIPSELAYKPGEIATDRKHKDMMSLALVNAKKYKDIITMPQIRRLLYRDIYASAYNNTVEYLMAYVTSLDIDPWIEIWKHPLVQQAIDLGRQYPEGVNEDGEDMVEVAYTLIEQAFRDPVLENNEVVLIVKDESLNINQVLQAYIRGKGTEINSTVYGIPTWDGFLNGINTLAGGAKESRSAARSNLFNTENVADAEYGSRKFQLVCNVVMNQYDGDCGTPYYHVQEMGTDRQAEDQLKNMSGFSFRLETGAPWRRIEKRNYKELLGKTIQYRSPMCCLKMAEQGVCRVCYGEMFDSLSEKAAAGQLSTVQISQKGTQGILSTKHLDFLRTVVSLVMRGDVSRYFNLYEHQRVKGLTLRDKAPIGNWNEYRIFISAETFSSLEIVKYEDNLDLLDISQVTDLDSMIFTRLDKNGDVYDEDYVNIQMGINGYLSEHFLRYYKTVVGQVTKYGKGYMVPIVGWNFKKPILQYHNRSESLAEFVDGYEAKVRSSSVYDAEERLTTKKVKNKSLPNLVSMGGATEEECTHALVDIHRYLDRKLKGINLIHIAMVLACSRIESWENPFPAAGFDSEPADNVNGKRFVKHDELMGLRSAGGYLIFERQQDYVDEIGVYVRREIPTTKYDGAFVALDE